MPRLGHRANLEDQGRSTVCAKGSLVGPGCAERFGFGKCPGKSFGQFFGYANGFSYSNGFC